MTVIINGTDNSASTPAVTGTDGDTGMFYPAANTVALSTGGSERMRVDSSGNVGIGTTSPSTYGKFAVSGLAFGSSYYVTSSSGGVAGGARFGAYFGSVNVGYVDHAVTDGTGGAESADIRFGTINSGTLAERARITSGGYFKASNAGTYSNNASHELRQSANDLTLLCYSTNASYTSNLIYGEADRVTTNNTYYFLSFVNNNAFKFRVADSGNVTNVNNSYGAISDVKLKQDIVDAGSQWDDIKNLRVRKYRWKSDPNGFMQMGLVAQEAEEVSPGLIDEHPDYEEVEVTDEEGKVTTERQATGTVTKSVKYSVLYMKAVKALQEAMERIETLEAKVAALEGAE